VAELAKNMDQMFNSTQLTDYK